MAQFSIKEAVKFAFSTFQHRFALLITASSLVAAASLLSSAILTFLIEGRFVSNPKAMQKFIENINTTSLTQILVIGASFIFFGMVSSLLYLGFIRLSLALKDHHKPELPLLFKTSFWQLLRFMGAMFVAVLGVILVLITILALLFGFIALTKIALGENLAKQAAAVLGIVGLLFVLYRYLPYGFFIYYFASHEKCGIFEAFKSCGEKFKDSRWQLVKAISVLTVCIVLLSISAIVLLMKSGMSVDLIKQLIQTIATIVLYPIGFLYQAYLYRTLSAK